MRDRLPSCVRRLVLLTLLTLGLLAGTAPGRSASGGGGERPSAGQSCSILRQLCVALPLRARTKCTSPADPTAGATDAEDSLVDLIQDVPCPASRRVSYGTEDSLGEIMGVLDPIDDPRGGYLAVYHSPFGRISEISQPDYRVSLGYSTDLLHWRRLAILDPSGASMPTLRAVPGGHGYLLAYEKSRDDEQRRYIRVRYYPTLDALLRGRFSAEIDLPRLLSPYGNGTPSFLQVQWHGRLRRSRIELGFHYTEPVPGEPFASDREAIGVLSDFTRWRARPDAGIDDRLDGSGMSASHGDRRQFRYDGQLWRVYEAQASTGDFSTWHVLLYDPTNRTMQPLTLSTATGRYATSFGNPTVQVLRAPTGNGDVLVVTLYVFDSGPAAVESGELVYYQPLS